MFKPLSFSLFILIMSLSIVVKAQDCNCDFTITPDNALGGYDPNNIEDLMNIKGGDTICIKGGTYNTRMMFLNFVGEPGNPIVFINCKGKAIYETGHEIFGINFKSSKHVRLTGSGDPAVKYGIKIADTDNGSGVSFNDLCSDFEIDHLEVANTGFAGIVAKTDPTCEPATWQQNFTMKNVSIHDNYVHDTHGEGFYIGFTGYSGKERNCDGNITLVKAHYIDNLKVYNNITENTGWDGIQVSMARNNCEIYGNVVKNYGVGQNNGQDHGIIIGGGTRGKLYNNQILEGRGYGIAMFGSGDNWVFNNVIYKSGVDGIFIRDVSSEDINNGYHFINNTIVYPGVNEIISNGIRFYGEYKSKGNEFINNLVVISKEKYNHYKESYNRLTTDDAFIYIRQLLNEPPVDATLSNNKYFVDYDSVGFVNPDNLNFSISQNSPAINEGKDVSNYGINFDLAFNSRPDTTTMLFDVGAFEFGTGSFTPPFTDPSKINKSMIIFPNPLFNSNTGNIEIVFEENVDISIKLYDVNGRLNNIFIDNKKYASGKHTIPFEINEKLNAGLYILVCETNNKVRTAKLVVN